MGCISKLALFILNFIVFAVGVAVVALASMIIHKNSIYGRLLSDGIFTVPVLVLIAGLFIVVLGFLGCCGAMKENSCMLKTYAVIVSLLLIAEIVLGIMLLVYADAAENTIVKGMKNVFENYGKDDEALTKSIDNTQHELKCCGVLNYTDWVEFKGNDVSKGCCLPDKVEPDCFKGKASLSLSEAQKYIYTDGCYNAIKEDLKGATIGLGVACLILGIVQIMSISCACGIAKKSSHYA